MDDLEPTFELRNQASGAAACFHPVPVDYGRVWKPGGHGSTLTIRKRLDGWIGLDQAGAVVARPWEPRAGLELDTPPAVTWVRRDDTRAYLLELVYPPVHSWLTCCQSSSL